MSLTARIALSALLLTSCVPSQSDERRVEYACGTTRVDVVFRGDTALVSSGETALSLPLAISASGARYSDGTYTYWEHQGTALFELPDTSYEGCLPGVG